MSDGRPAIVAVITGERGQREIVRPLAAVRVTCATLDWEELRRRSSHPYLRFVIDLWRVIRANRGAVVFTDMNSAFLAMILLAAKLHGSRVLLRLRGDPFAETRDQMRFHLRHRRWTDLARVCVAALLDRPLLTAIDRFVPVSNWIVRRLRIEGRSEVVRIPVELAQFPAHRAQASSSELLKMLAVTNFNYASKVAALGRFLEEHGTWLQGEGWEILVAGAGDSLQTFQAEHATHAQFLGFVEAVADLYASADVFIHFSDLDAFPYVVLEAQASGLPVVVNRDCGMLEQVDHRRTGLIVDLEDFAEVRLAFRKLATSPQLRQQLGAAAREHVGRSYSLEQIGRQLAEMCA